MAQSPQLEYKPHLIEEIATTITAHSPREIQAQEIYGSDNVTIVNINDFYQSVEGGKIKLQLPGINCEPVFSVVSVDIKSDNSIEWLGEINPSEEVPADHSYSQCWDGYLILKVENGMLSAVVSLTDDWFEVFSLDASSSILVRRTQNDLSNGFTCGNADTTEIYSQGQSNSPVNQSSILIDTTANQTLKRPDPRSNCPVKVLALYSESSSNFTLDVEEYINLAFLQTTLAMQGSGISTTLLNFDLIDIIPVSASNYSPPQSGNSRLGINELISNQFIRDLRDEKDADIVIMYTGEDFPTVGGRILEVPLPNDEAYIIAEVSEPLFRHTTPHEVGHIFGALHQRCNRCSFWNAHLCPRPFCSEDDELAHHAYWFRTAWWPISNRKHTIVDAGEDEEKRLILRYSNPAKEFAGEPTGTEIDNNVSEILLNACDVAGFRGDDNNFVVHIKAPDVVCECATVQVHAEASGGAAGIIDYAWSISDNGGSTYESIPGDYPSIYVNMNCANGSLGTLVRVVATDANQVTASSTKFLFSTTDESESDVYCHYELQGSGNSNNKNLAGEGRKLEVKSEVKLYPNPTIGEINYILNEEQKISSLRIIDLNGRTVILLEDSQIPQTGKIDVTSLTSGIYHFSIKTPSKVIINKIVVR